MEQKPFFRESNVWRLIGLAVIFGAGILAAITGQGGFDYEHKSITVPGIIAIIGGLLILYPLLKEGFYAWKGKPLETPEKLDPNLPEKKP